MLAYATHNNRARRSSSPTSLALIVGAHALALALVLTAKMELTTTPPEVITDIFDVPIPKPPTPPPPKADPSPTPPTDTLFVPERPIPLPPQPGPDIQPGPPQPIPMPPSGGTGTGSTPLPRPPIRDVVRSGPRFVTPDSALRPPYPLAKMRNEEEATLRLKLSIDAKGRVIAVDPVGKADALFLDSARKHILKAWRYKPALEDGVAVPSTTIISLAFRLENA